MKKLTLLIMILSFSIIFVLFNDSDYFKLKDYPVAKIITNSDSYKPDEDMHKVYSKLIEIEKKHGIDIIKFTKFKINNRIQYEFNHIGDNSLDSPDFFNREIVSTELKKGIKDENMVGIYYFTEYTDSINKDLTSIGLSIMDSSDPSIFRRIFGIIYDNYFYLLILSLILYIVKLSYSRQKNRLLVMDFVSFKWAEKKFIILVFFLNLFFLMLLRVYNSWALIIEFLFYYAILFFCITIFFIVVYTGLQQIFKLKFFKNIDNRISYILFLMSRFTCFLFIYVSLLSLAPATGEVYLSYVKRPLESVSEYNVVDLTSYSPEFYYGTKNIENDYKDFIIKQKDVVLSAYNVGYDFHKNNYDPYSGNSLLVSPNYFDVTTVKDYKGKKIKFTKIGSDSEIYLIIPISQKKNSDRIQKMYTEWANFLTDIPVEKLEIKLSYSEDGQNVYSYGFQSNTSGLTLESPIIMVINPKVLSADQVTAFLSNRFFAYKPDSQFDKDEIYKSYFAEMSKIKYLVNFYSLVWLIRWINILVSVCVVVLLLMRIQENSQVKLVDLLIVDVVTLTLINILFPFNNCSYFILIFLMMYYYIKRKLWKRRIEI